MIRILTIVFFTAWVSGEDSTVLFNGTDYTGWFGSNPHTTNRAKDKAGSLAAQAKDFAAHWSVENGEMVNDGKGPYATTDKEYGDVEFEVEVVGGSGTLAGADVMNVMVNCTTFSTVGGSIAGLAIV